MIDVPLPGLLQIAQDDLHRNQAAFAATARQIDPAKTSLEVLDQCSRTIRRPTACSQPPRTGSTSSVDS